MIEIVEYQPAWGQESQLIGRVLRQIQGDLALRIDHSGSTSIRAMPAKDAIDVQITAQDFEPVIQSLLNGIGYQETAHLSDHVPPKAPGTQDEWRKWFFTEPAGARRIDLHVRQGNRPNQRYPLFFRDYLRMHPAAAEAYGLVKKALARLHPDGNDAYYELKDPVCDIVLDGPEAWSAATG